jgi:Mrp family chromosome partitioning ATPase
MSALDQAFIKAFSREPVVVTSRAKPVVRGTQAGSAPTETTHYDELYDAGTFYRVDSAGAEQVVPASHLAPERKLPRRLQRRGASRPELDFSIPVEAEPHSPAPQASAPPRRNWSRSMLEIARQLAQYDLLHKDPEADIAPEIVALDPPEPVADISQANVPVAVEPESPSQAIAHLWSVDAEIMTQSVVELADAETWLALPIAPAVTCHENVADGWNIPASEGVEALSEAPSPTTAEETAAIEHHIKRKRKFRIDASHPRVPRPHQRSEVKAAEVDLGEESQLSEETPITAAPPVVETAPVASSPPVVETPTSEPIPEPATTTTVPKRPYVPLWEVDRLTWPPLCDKLMHDPNGYFANASNKLLSVVRGGLKVLGITGSRRGEGRTTLALCLARAAAQAGIHVALVDADFARPQLASMLGLETAYGWQEAAIGKIPLSEAAVKSLADRVTILPLEVSTSDAPLSLADPRVTATLRATAATFELVLVDLGPLNATNEPLFPVGENCPLDAAIVVRDTRYASVNESRLVGDRLYEAGIEAVGVAENFVTQPELAFL